MSTKTKIIIALTISAGLIYFLSLVFSGLLILPQFFSFGPITIHYYGIIMAAAAAAGFYLALKRAPKFGVDQKKAEDLLFWIIIGGFIGARLYHVLSSAGYYSGHLTDIFKVWNGGLSIYGAVIGGITTLQIYQKPWKKRLVSRVTLDTLDWLAPSVLVGQIIGRLGNLFNYEAFGYPTNLPWKMFVPPQFRPENFSAANFFHPFFLYEALGNLIVLLLLLKVIKSKHPGVLFFSYVLLYNMLRFGLEFLRIDSTFIGLFRLNAIVSFVLIIFSAAALSYVRKNNAETP